MTVVEKFDTHNIEHLKAWRHLEKTGCWPEGFLDEGDEVPILWAAHIAAKMATAWLDHMLGKK